MYSTSIQQKSYKDFLSLWHLAIIPLVLCAMIELIPFNSSKTDHVEQKKTELVPPIQTNITQDISIPINIVKPTVFNGSVGYSFYGSALASGASPDTIGYLTSLAAGKFDFIHSVSRSGQFVFKIDDKNQLEAFLYRDKMHMFYVYSDNKGVLFSSDGEHFYKDKLLLSPVSRQFRVSSQFNLSRMHPITHKVTPHMGTDYAVPVGTPVVSISSGRVVASHYHPLAGNYIVILHPDGLKTRYLHLSKRFVNRGDNVIQGQKVGASGNTGRTTGAHLHFELWKDGRPIDFEKKRTFAEKVAVEQISAQTADAKTALKRLARQIAE
ncbi:peptidoglycan DD-metalloendopeptidase family protein [Vibrio pectenicida]|uniref:Peptidoglycan DD-metalloendopeptidase family protein n=1 Tax=Vibrio pectenicida TaxID=62763 RepID=A0A7Y4A1X8_9VIBR|nr:peptidoglycan DD-metalloendopeptidase family protein [Vibrio pectenicida]NOH73230.1 peptidoglycan DD-metalloendopeptidase family protein [Vibrio pectenicida]